MNFQELMHKRYTAKNYNPDKKIPAEQIEALKDILNYSPSSINSQPWKFYFIESQAVKEQLAEASFFNKPKILNASDLIVFTAFKTPQDFENVMESYLQEGAINYYNAKLKSLDAKEIINWMSHQVYITLGVLLTAAASLGIDATPMEGIENDKYDEILGLQDTHTLFAVTLGYRTDDDFNQPELIGKTRRPQEEIIKVI